MTQTPIDQRSTPKKPLRLWPGVVFVTLQWALWFVVPVVAPDAGFVGMIGGIVAGLLIVVWWLAFSRAPWLERVGAIVLMIAAVIAIRSVVDKSISGAGMGNLLYVMSVPGLCLGLVAWAAATRQLSSGARRMWLAVAMLLSVAPWTLLRTAGVSSTGSEFHWRWTPTPEDLLLARADDAPKSVAAATSATEAAKQPAAAPSATIDAARSLPPSPRTAAPVADKPAVPAVLETPAEWPGFRGGGRDSIVRGARINTDWAASPPVEMWRRAIGPGWSSFAVHGDLLYTQEQRGDDEIVACYRVSTGEPVWKHRDAARFYESNGGPGPRGTPTLSGGRVYAMGATGILNALDARTGTVVWSRRAAADTKAVLPGWGFSSSPLVVGDTVIVATSGAMAAYDLVSGTPRWIGAVRGSSYSSPHLVTIDGVQQIVLLNGTGATSTAPADGALLWEHAWDGGAIVQPAVTADGDILINAMSATGGTGTRRLHVSRGSGAWTVEERWTSNGLKPYFNDFVVHKGRAFGFDGNILACINLEDGKRLWKGGRYGNGQLMLLPDQDLLLVLAEEGELALVAANADKFTELARFPALDAKTWNHPVLVGDVLLVRNGEEMAAFRLSPAKPSQPALR